MAKKHSSTPDESTKTRSANVCANTQNKTLQIGCKINLSLRITGVRPDGWHELDTYFVPLPEPYDTLELTWVPVPKGVSRQPEDAEDADADSSQSGLTVQCSSPDIDLQHNTLTIAYDRYAAATGFRPKLTATLHKGIPLGSGLGGGSADAAVLLLWLNGQCPRPLDVPSLLALAEGVGADVPFFLYNCPCWATGTGDELTPSDCLEQLKLYGSGLLLLYPHIHISTPHAYAAWDVWQKKKAMDLTEKSDARIYRLSRGVVDDKRIASASVVGYPTRKAIEQPIIWLENSFESPIFAEHPRLRQLKERLLQAGAFVAVMSGSGSALFGLFRTDNIDAIAECFREKDVTVYSYAL